MEYYEHEGNIEPVYVVYKSSFLRILKKCNNDLDAPGRRPGNNYIIKVDFPVLFGVTLWLLGFSVIFLMSVAVHFTQSDDEEEMGRILPLLSAVATFGLLFFIVGALTCLYAVTVHPDTKRAVDEMLRRTLGHNAVDVLWNDLQETLRILCTFTLPIIVPFLVILMMIGLWPKPNMEQLRDDPIYQHLRYPNDNQQPRRRFDNVQQVINYLSEAFQRDIIVTYGSPGDDDDVTNDTTTTTNSSNNNNNDDSNDGGHVDLSHLDIAEADINVFLTLTGYNGQCEAHITNRQSSRNSSTVN